MGKILVTFIKVLFITYLPEQMVVTCGLVCDLGKLFKLYETQFLLLYNDVALT